MIGRWITGLFKYLFRIFDTREWAYFAHTGMDPKLPAFSRWELALHSSDKAPESAADELLPKKNHMLILHDKAGLTQDDVVYFNSELGRVQVLEKKLEDELRTRNAGWFWHDQIRHRNLDFIHGMKLGEDIDEGNDADDMEETRRQFFRG